MRAFRTTSNSRITCTTLLLVFLVVSICDLATSTGLFSFLTSGRRPSYTSLSSGSDPDGPTHEEAPLSKYEAKDTPTPTEPRKTAVVLPARPSPQTSSSPGSPPPPPPTGLPRRIAPFVSGRQLNKLYERQAAAAAQKRKLERQLALLGTALDSPAMQEKHFDTIRNWAKGAKDYVPISEWLHVWSKEDRAQFMELAGKFMVTIGQLKGTLAKPYDHDAYIDALERLTGLHHAFMTLSGKYPGTRPKNPDLGVDFGMLIQATRLLAFLKRHGSYQTKEGSVQFAWLSTEPKLAQEVVASWETRADVLPSLFETAYKNLIALNEAIGLGL